MPPNFLVGEGAVDFAEAHGVNIMPRDFLVSEGARHRWESWKRDLLKVEADQHEDETAYQEAASAVKSAPNQYKINGHALSPPVTPRGPGQFTVLSSNVSKHATADGPATTYSRALDAHLDDDGTGTDDHLSTLAQTRKRRRMDGSNSDSGDMFLDLSTRYLNLGEDHCHTDAGQIRPPQRSIEDRITDTVGAIAIDCYGRIAAGSSSGGIGMKHKGRCGPAALVGISTAVIPADPDDPCEQCVATVTSGTGEHMATTAAAQTAADRILSCTRKVGGQLEACHEDDALFSMIRNDFMKHPGVQNSPCQGAIGVLCVKKTKQGIYFYFGHNTDSFALASMHSDERKPVCVMSRSRESGLIAQGARKCRARRATRGS